MRRKVFAILFVAAVLLAAAGLHAADWNFKGFFNTNFEYEARQGKFSSFDPFIFAVITDVNFDGKTLVRLQVNYEHGPYIELETENNGGKELESAAYGEISATSAYVQYTVAEYLRICVGKFFAPIGFYNQIGYSPTYASLKTPAASVYKKGEGPSGDLMFFQRQAAGLWLNGNVSVLGQYLSYDAYYVNGRAFEIQTDVNSHKSTGGRVKYEINTGGLSIVPAVSLYNDEYNAGALDAPDYKSQFSIMPALEINAGDFNLKGEVALSRISKGGAAEKEFTAFYAETQYTFAEMFTPFLRFEFLEPDTKTAGDRVMESTAGILYHLKLWTSLIKAQVRYHQSENDSSPSYLIYGAGVALGF